MKGSENKNGIKNLVYFLCGLWCPLHVVHYYA